MALDANVRRVTTKPSATGVLEGKRRQSDGPVFSVVFVPTLSCNCRCLHCFETLDDRRIADGSWEMIFAKMHELAETVGCRTLRLYWQGGEVLCLDPDSVRRGLEVGAAVFGDNGVTLEHYFQTNLLLYDTSRWKDVVSKFSLGKISSSLDFPNLYRMTPSLTAEEYTRAWMQKKELAQRDGFVVSVISLPNPETLRLGAERFYRFFKEEVGVTNVQVNFPFPGKNGALQPLDLEELARFMTDLYEVWVASDRDLNLSPFQALEGRLFHHKGRLPCVWAYSCADTLLAIGPDGEVAQCDCWVSAFKERCFGSLVKQPVDTVLNSSERRLFLERPLKLARDSKCGECKFWKLCNGGCPVRAFTFTGDMFAPDHYCQVYDAMFSAVWENAGRQNQSSLK